MLSEAQPNDLVIVPTQSKDELRLSNGQSFDGLDRSWGNSRDWVLELWDGRQLVIPLSLYRSTESLTDFTGSEDDSGVAWDALSINGGSKGELWGNLLKKKKKIHLAFVKLKRETQPPFDESYRGSLKQHLYQGAEKKNYDEYQDSILEK